MQWTVTAAAKEFDWHRETLNKALTRIGTKPDGDGKFSTRDICAAIYGDVERQRLRKITAEARLAELQVSTAEKSLIPTAVVQPMLDSYAITIRNGFIHMPDLISDELARTSDRGKVREILERKIWEAMDYARKTAVQDMMTSPPLMEYFAKEQDGGEADENESPQANEETEIA